MPVMTCTKDGMSGHKWGHEGVCFVGPDSAAHAAKVGAAIHAQEKGMSEMIQFGANIAKSVNVEKQELTCVVLRPDMVDLQGEIYSAEEVEKACRSFNEFSMQGNIQHADENTDALVFVESYVAPASFVLGEGAVLKGDWIATVKVTDATLWDKVLKGDYTGLSIGCNATVEKLEDAA